MHNCKSRLCETPHYETGEQDYQSAYDSVTEIKCPIGMLYDCYRWMDREDLAKHLEAHHPDNNQDPEHYWEIEAQHRFEKGPYWNGYKPGIVYAA